MLAEKTLLKTAYHFLLLLVGFDTLTYRKDYDRSPTLVGHHLSHSLAILLTQEHRRFSKKKTQEHRQLTVSEKIDQR